MASFMACIGLNETLCKLGGMRRGERQKIVAFSILAQYRQRCDIWHGGSDAAFDFN